MELFGIIYLASMNLAAYALMGIDKRRAVRHAWRIPEKTLFLSAVLGGSIGAIIGMRHFRHKTRHWRFVYGMPAILLIQLGILSYLLIRLYHT